MFNIEFTFKLTNKSNGALANDIEDLIKKGGLNPQRRPNSKNKRRY